MCDLMIERASVKQVLRNANVTVEALPPPQAWTAVLGIGSNGSPEQLARKFPPSKFPQAVIPAVRCALQDFDVVYAPLIASYGSCTGRPNVLARKSVLMQLQQDLQLVARD